MFIYCYVLQFQVNDLGVLEVINDSLECNETLNTSDELDKMDPAKLAPVKEQPERSAPVGGDVKQGMLCGRGWRWVLHGFCFSVDYKKFIYLMYM